MKPILLLFILVLSGNMVLKGQNISFDYDEAGNRVSRITITLEKKVESEIKQLQDSQKNYDDQLFSYENLADVQVKVFPNPTSGFLQIMLTNVEDPENVSIQIFTTSGQLLEEKNLSSDNDIIDMNQFTEGIYILKVNYLDQKIEYKVIKQ